MESKNTALGIATDAVAICVLIIAWSFICSVTISSPEPTAAMAAKVKDS